MCSCGNQEIRGSRNTAAANAMRVDAAAYRRSPVGPRTGLAFCYSNTITLRHKMENAGVEPIGKAAAKKLWDSYNQQTLCQQGQKKITNGHINLGVRGGISKKIPYYWVWHRLLFEMPIDARQQRGLINMPSMPIIQRRTF